MARTTETPSTNLAAAAPAALVAWPKSIDVPLSGPKRQNSSEQYTLQIHRQSFHFDTKNTGPARSHGAVWEKLDAGSEALGSARVTGKWCGRSLRKLSA